MSQTCHTERGTQFSFQGDLKHPILKENLWLNCDKKLKNFRVQTRTIASVADCHHDQQAYSGP